MKNQITNPEFFAGGRALFTVANSQGSHYTYKINRHKEKDLFFAGLVNAAGTYLYLGMFNRETGAIVTTRKSTAADNSETVRVLRWAITMVKANAPMPDGYTIQHEGRCCRCGRALTHPESIETGIGPECSGKGYSKARKPARQEVTAQ